MQGGGVMQFYEACERMYKAIRKSGHPGISAAGDCGNAWIFAPAPEHPGEYEYGLVPYFVDKKTGSVSCFSVAEDGDWDRIEEAKQIDVPAEFQPKYNIKPLPKNK